MRLPDDSARSGRLPVLLNWQASNRFGWGLAGLGVLQHWASDPEVAPIMAFPVRPQDVQGIDPLRWAAIEPAVTASNRAAVDLAAGRLDLKASGAVVIDALGNSFRAGNSVALGARHVARCVFENTLVPDDLDERLARYEAIVCVSNWNAELVRARSTKPVHVVHEGIDESLFFPGPRSRVLDPGRFYVFSGGKVEFRKAQDLVLLAFREFASRHEDAVLVAAWHSPWTRFSAGFQGRLSHPLGLAADGSLQIRRWAVENGVPERQFVELPAMPNPLVPAVLREMDCALQVSRCEAGTNFPAKEAMACGVPVILAVNTGVRDLADEDNCVPLRDQRAVKSGPEQGTDNWGESSVEEIVDALERLYSDADLRRRISAAGVRWLIDHERTWWGHAGRLKAAVLGLF